MTLGYLNLMKNITMNAKKSKEERKKFWESLKILPTRKKKKNTYETNMESKKKKDLGIFWEAEADIIRTDLLNRDVP